MSIIAGIDEVGRGSLAGPVVAAVVVSRDDIWMSELKDSKQISKSKRIEYNELIKRNAMYYSLSYVNNKIIDKINILQATLLAMRIAYKKLNIKVDQILIDGIHAPTIKGDVKCIKSGDSKIKQISAASIIAKVFRDQVMERYSRVFPYYGFENNSGYGTKFHINAIKEFGYCPIHRKSFILKSVK